MSSIVQNVRDQFRKNPKVTLVAVAAVLIALIVIVLFYVLLPDAPESSVQARCNEQFGDLLALIEAVQLDRLSPSEFRQELSQLTDDAAKSCIETAKETLADSRRLNDVGAKAASVAGLILLLAVIFGPIALMSASFEEPPDENVKVEHRTNRVIFVISVFVWSALMVSNWISMISPRLDYEWPNGWFNGDLLVGYALAGVAINILVTHLFRTRTREWRSSDIGLYAFRILEATVFVTVIYQIARFFLPPSIEAIETCRNFPQCLTQGSSLFLILGLFVGLAVSRIEGLLLQILPLDNWRQQNRKTQRIRNDYEKLRRKWLTHLGKNRPASDEDWSAFNSFKGQCHKMDRLLLGRDTELAISLLHDMELDFRELQLKQQVQGPTTSN